MNRLDICLSQSDYSVRYGCPIERLAVRGGHDRYIKSTNAKKHIVSASIKVSRDDFKYFRAFYRNWQLKPEKFLIKLILDDGEYKDYEANFVKESVSMSFVADFFTVSFELSVLVQQVRVFTSLMYPFEFDESVGIGFSTDDYNIRDIIIESNIEDNLLMSFSLDSMFLRSLYVSIESAESILTSFSLDSATIDRQSIAKKELNDQINVSFEINSITRRRALISTALNDSIATSFSLNSATRG